MKLHRKAKIIATLGPASSSPEVIRKLIEAGANIFRLNFSHGTYADHRARYDTIRALEAELDQPIGILQDLQGPKIRIGTLKNGPVMLERGASVRFKLTTEPGDAEQLSLNHPEVINTIQPGHKFLIDDGKLQLRCTARGADYFDAEVLVGGIVSERKGVNLPDTALPISPLTDKDRADLAFGLELGVDWIALSFVQRAEDVAEAKALIDGRARVMSKIEKPLALEHIDGIVAESDAIMVARGDLGVEIAPEDVPGAQKELIRLCRKMGKPVVVATQMLESMIKTPTPTRAEASDVATAIYDSADCVMLSAESASGDWPAEAVAMMDRIITHTENHKLYRSLIDAIQPNLETTPAQAVADAAADVADALGAAAIVAFTTKGTTAYRIARKRPRVPILGVSPDMGVTRGMALLWGVQSCFSPGITSYDDMETSAREQALKQGVAVPGDRIVVIAGIPFGQAGSTNNLRVLTV
ncbi:MAG TPA: pyruvate kinase [Alphaproteobacteria bacterium]|nr:pyruvate kinase [Alphaproteobacteria bacterium]